MKPDISEFSYGFALTSELMQSYGLQRVGAPYFPSLTSEGAPGGGYDMQLPGVPIFFQFKLSDCLTTRNALDHGRLGLPYYRFKTRARRHSQQHQLLLDLEAESKIVFYAAPRFHTPDELNDAFRASAVIARSAFVAPSGLGPLPDPYAHSVSFNQTSPLGILHSEPSEIELADVQGLLEKGQAVAWRAREHPQTFRELGDQLIGIYEAHRSDDEAYRALDLRPLALQRDPRDYVKYLALTLFDSEVMIIPRRQTA